MAKHITLILLLILAASQFSRAEGPVGRAVPRAGFQIERPRTTPAREAPKAPETEQSEARENAPLAVSDLMRGVYEKLGKTRDMSVERWMRERSLQLSEATARALSAEYHSNRSVKSAVDRIQVVVDRINSKGDMGMTAQHQQYLKLLLTLVATAGAGEVSKSVETFIKGLELKVEPSRSVTAESARLQAEQMSGLGDTMADALILVAKGSSHAEAVRDAQTLAKFSVTGRAPCD